MIVSTSTTIRLGGEEPAEVRSGWRCPSCGVNYSPDITACHCSPLPALPAQPVTPFPGSCTCGAWNSVTPPPPCPVRSGLPVITITCSGVNDVPRQLGAELSRFVRTSAGQVRRTASL